MWTQVEQQVWILLYSQQMQVEYEALTKKIGNVTENITRHFSEFEGVCGSDMQVSSSVSSRRDGIDQIENGQNSHSDLTDV